MGSEMKVRQHIPGFISGVEPEEAEVASTEDLLALPWVARIEKMPGFHRWVKNRGFNGRWNLMIEVDEGKSWWVIAYVTGDLLLPEWDEKSAMALKRAAPVA